MNGSIPLRVLITGAFSVLQFNTPDGWVNVPTVNAEDLVSHESDNAVVSTQDAVTSAETAVVEEPAALDNEFSEAPIDPTTPLHEEEQLANTAPVVDASTSEARL